MFHRNEKTDFQTSWKAAKAASFPGSPLSPKMGAFHAKLRNRIPTQMRRTLPLYLICVTLFIFVLYADMLGFGKARPIVIKHIGSAATRASTSRTHRPAQFPNKIWQTWKIDPFNFAQRDFETARSWTIKNPSWRYEVLTDNNDMLYVEEQYGPNGLNRPDIVDFYRILNTTIIKADLLRYMIMYAEGGVYTDIDVEALKPATRFIPARYRAEDIDMVIGVEIDQPEFRDHPILGQKSMSFCQWTFMCKPGLPVMMRLIEGIMAWLTDVAAAQNVPISDIQLDFDEVISGTGPSAFTAAVLAEMNELAPGEKITWDRFHAMDESKLVSRVLVLTVEAFAAGQGHSDSGNHDARGALVKHHYHASNWPSKHPRFSHPAYGEVERCNWNAECVRKWDENVEAYKSLSPEEQQKKIAERKAEIDRQIEDARRMQEKAKQLEQLGLSLRKAEEERAKQEADAQQVPPGQQAFPPQRQRIFGMADPQDAAQGQPAKVFGGL
ncbi:nucleotide-diphospho-sugar transferase [Podospora aff. communis PSN243]|uniref:Nucleotide-diphospho-sugar transferase n=1 Tax=Podospora aff. communis PSN243 TaxID=3040156 RepID=A0AAV9G7F7_9PEZI|nr:nucleotide-diphospho-sugar transferase [Podospora aff. communis PSN243]